MSDKEERERAFGAVVFAGLAIATGGASAALQAGAGLGTALAAGATALTTASFSQLAFYTALGYASGVGTKVNIGPASGGYSINVNPVGSALPTSTVYGRTRVGGTVFYQEVIDKTSLNRMIAFANHEIEEFEEIYFNSEKVTATGEFGGYKIVSELTDEDGTIRTSNISTRFQQRLGTNDQEYIPIYKGLANFNFIYSTVWNEEHRAVGVAYLGVNFGYSRDGFPNGVPVVSATVKGKKIYDPRTDTTAWSDNPALILRDYLISSGVAYDSSEVDDTLFVAAANICDEIVTLDDGSTQKRYVCNASFTSEEQPQNIIRSISDTMAGMVWYQNGKWGCKAASYTAPVMTFDEDDLRSGLSITTRNSRRQGYNKVIGLFKGDETNWQPANFPSVESAEFLKVDNYDESTLELDFPFISNSAQAQRVAKISLFRNREQLKVSGSFGMRALQVGVGDIVNITNSRLGFSSKQFEVIEWTFGLSGDMTLEVAMVLQEISAAVFERDPEQSVFESNNTTLVSPFEVPDVGVTLSNESRVINQHLTNLIAVDVTSSRPEEIDVVEVEYLKYNNQIVKYNDLSQSLSYSPFGNIPHGEGVWGVAQALGLGLIRQVNADTQIFYFGWVSGGPTESFFDAIRGETGNTQTSFTENDFGNFDEFTFTTSQVGKEGSAKFDVRFIRKVQSGPIGGGYYIVSVRNVNSIGDLTSLSTSAGVNVFFAWDFLRTGTETGYTFLGRGELGRFEIIDASVEDVDNPDFSTYSVRARAFNTLGVSGAYTEAGRSSQHDTTGPAAVTNVEKNFSEGSLHLDWEPSTSGDLSHYKIHRNYETSGAAFTDQHTLPVVNRVARPSSDVFMNPQIGTFFIEPYDKAGNAGTVASIAVTADDLDGRTYATSYTASGANADFQTTIGSLVNATILSSSVSGYAREIRLDDYAFGSSEGSYESYGENNLGSDKIARLSVGELVVQRHSDDAYNSFGQRHINFDDLPNNIDSWPKDYTFDNFILEGANFRDVFIEVFAAAKKDGAGSYGDFTKLPCTLEGKLFKYKYVLKSTSDNVTPVLLKAVVNLEYN